MGEVTTAVVFVREFDGWIGYCPTVPSAVAGDVSLSVCRRKLRDAIVSVLLYAPREDLATLAEVEPREVRAEFATLDVPDRQATDLVTQSDIARLASVSRQAVNGWVRRRDFPRPYLAEGRSSLWERDDVLRWLATDRPVGRPPRRSSLPAAG